MKNLVLFSICVSAFIAIACGGSSESPANNARTQVVNANPANNAGLVPYTPANSAANANVAADANVPVTVTKLNGEKKPITYAAPDDSDYNTSMDSKGEAVETRTFHSDKYLTKVVRTWKSPSDKTISIYLKSGKVVNLPGDEWPDIKGQPVENFYAAAGIKPAATGENKAASTKSEEKSKPDDKQ